MSTHQSIEMSDARAAFLADREINQLSETLRERQEAERAAHVEWREARARWRDMRRAALAAEVALRQCQLELAQGALDRVAWDVARAAEDRR